MATGYYTYENADKGFTIACMVEGTVVPFIPPTRDQPADGGYLEDVTFTVTDFSIVIGDEHFDMALALTDDLRSALAAVALIAYETDIDAKNDVYAQIMSERGS